MLILVANLGSTSFKYKLFDMSHEERVLAVGSAERIGAGKPAPSSRTAQERRGAWSVRVGEHTERGEASFADHRAAIDLHLDALPRLGAIKSLDQIDAIGFKAVHAGEVSGSVIVDDHVIDAMERFVDAAPAHNPPYIAAMRAFDAKLPGTPQVAAFETGFHQTIPEARQVYAIPWEWTQKLGVRRYGFHGASHRYIATRMAQIAPDAKRIINLHLGGSSSVCAIRDGKSVATSMGMTPQSGLLQNNRVGEFDVFTLPMLMKSGLDVETILHQLSTRGGLLGVSGVSGDMRQVHEAADAGNDRARLALEVFVEACRHYVGAYLAVLGGADAITFTGGIGQHDAEVRRLVCADLDFAGVVLDESKNAQATGNEDQRLDAGETVEKPAPSSRTLHERRGGAQVWVVPTNEELIVARQTFDVLQPQEQRV